MLKQLNSSPIVNSIRQLVKKGYFFPILAFLLPFIFYFSVFFGRSFGFDCATGIMGFKPPYQQTLTTPNHFCANIADPGAYSWQHVPQWLKVGQSYSHLNFPLWNQNNALGIPLAANFISTAFFIFLIPFSFFKSIFSLDLFIIFRMSIASLGMFLFLRSLKIPKELSLVGSLVVFLNGYMTFLPSISHQSVDVILPWIGYLITKAAQERKIKYFILLSFITALSHLGGFPESSVFVALFFSAYASFISFFIIVKNRIFLLISYTASFIVSLLLSALLILPGYEYIANSFNIHSPNSQPYFTEIKNVYFFIFPKLVGSLHNIINQEIVGWRTPNYIGIITGFFLLLSVILLIFFKNNLKYFSNWKYFIFFLAFLMILLVQYFGIVHIPIFSKFPGFSQTNFPKYSLSLINLLIGLVIPFAILYQHQLINKANSIAKYALAVSPITATFLILYFFTDLTYLAFHTIAENHLISHELLTYLLLAKILLIAIFVLNLIKTKWKFSLIFLLISIELFLYIPNSGDTTRRDSLKKPPAIKYLEENGSSTFRIFSPDYILYPDLSSVFNLNDVRNLDALWPVNYYNYLKEFIVPDMDKTVMRFTGIREGNTSDAKIFHNNFFDLMSVKYLLSYTDVNAYEELQRISPYLNQINDSATLKKYFFTIDGRTKPILFEHAPNIVQLKITKPNGAIYFYLSAAMSEKIFNKPNSGDGVRFVAKLESNGKILSQNELTINPKITKSDQHWNEIKLGPIDPEDNELTLTLQTDQLKTNESDWAGWGGFLWDTQLISINQYQYKKVYDKELKIYENTKFVPRLHPVSQVICANNDQETLTMMESNKSELKNLAVITTPNCKIEKFDSRSIEIKNQVFDDQKVSFTYRSSQDSFVILSNQYYPGWKLKVDGNEVPIEKTNYTFQGFRLPKSNNSSALIYYDPISFKTGFVISLLTFISSIFIFIKFGNRQI